MPTKKKKKKPSASGSASHAALRSGSFKGVNPDVEDELTALESIFGDSIEVDADRQGFTLLIVPHPAEMDANYTSCELQLR